jgi:hypothetical protein
MEGEPNELPGRNLFVEIRDNGKYLGRREDHQNALTASYS